MPKKDMLSMEEKEFRQKVLPLQRMMYALALKIGLPPDDSADAVQETMLKLWRGRDGIPEEPRQLNAYCMVAMRNECLSVLKKLRQEQTLEQTVSSTTGSITDSIDAKDTRRVIERLIDTLPEGQGRVVRLSSFGDYDIAEIASVTGFSPGNVRQLLSRGRRKLREHLSHLNILKNPHNPQQ